LDLWNSKEVYGTLGEPEGVCCSSVNTGLYSAMKEMNDITHAFCGIRNKLKKIYNIMIQHNMNKSNQSKTKTKTKTKPKPYITGTGT
jgi:hypothetical protein